MSSHLHSFHRKWLMAAVVTACVLGVYQWKKSSSPRTPSLVSSASKLTVTVAIPDLDDPAENYDTFLYVLQSGGCEITRPVAIAWLDHCSREHQVPSSEQSTQFFTMLENGGHAAWQSGFRHHLFNSTLNVLHQSNMQERMTRLLQRLALQDPDKTMRLYALQHLGIQRRVGQLHGPLADEILSTLQTLARRKDGEESGYALDMLATWNDAEMAPATPAVQELALAIASDPGRSLDVRVSALHASGSSSLELARKLALDTTAPMPLRKAAIARIGHHGSAQDLVVLAELKKHSSRLAQAAEPAQVAIRSRNHNSSEKPRTPYQ